MKKDYESVDVLNTIKNVRIETEGCEQQTQIATYIFF
jgi:hypothetical protein